MQIAGAGGSMNWFLIRRKNSALLVALA